MLNKARIGRICRMRSCVPLLCSLLVSLSVVRPADAHQATPVTREADALYARREEPARARRAAEILAEAARRNPSDFEAAWRLARVRCWNGDHAPEGERRRQYELGVEAAKLAVAARPNRPEGHFWLGTNLGGLADLGVIAGIRYRHAVRQEFEMTARLDPGFEAGSAFTALRDWYLRVPRLLGGDTTKAEELLRRVLTHDPDSWPFTLEPKHLDRHDPSRAELPPQ
jgi:hypothetical protein